VPIAEAEPALAAFFGAALAELSTLAVLAAPAVVIAFTVGLQVGGAEFFEAHLFSIFDPGLGGIAALLAPAGMRVIFLPIFLTAGSVTGLAFHWRKRVSKNPNGFNHIETVLKPC